MTTTRTTIAGVDGVRQPVAGLDVRRHASARLQEAALVAVGAVILLLVAC